MGRVRIGGLFAAAAVICAAWAATAHGQVQVPQFQYTPPPSAEPSPVSNPDEYFRREKDYAKNWEDKQDKQDKQSSPWPGYHDPTAGWPSGATLMTWLEIGFAVLAVGVMGWLGLRAYARYARPSDPRKAALNDPWIRAQLAKSGALPNEPRSQAGDAPRY